MRFAEEFKRLRLLNELTQAELAARLGMSRSSIGMYEQGKREPDFETIEKIADYFNVTVASLLDSNEMASFYKNLRPIRPITLPILGSVSCGKPKYADQEFQGYVSIDHDVHADMVLVANGDSMVNAGIRDGYYVFVQCTQEIRNGDLAVVGIGDEALLKRFYYYPEKDFMLLRPENPDYEDLLIEGYDIQDVHVIGKAVFFQGPVK